MSLADELKRLGLELPAEALPEPESTAELIRDIMRVAFWDRDNRTRGERSGIDVDDAFETFVELDQQITRLAGRLQAHGIRAITTEDHIAAPRSDGGTASFAGVLIRSNPCDHPRVTVTSEREHLRCKSCGALVNPIWWLARYASTLRHAEYWKTHLKRERRELEAEIAELKRERANHKAAVRRFKKP